VIDEKFGPETENMLEGMKVIVIQASINDEDIYQKYYSRRVNKGIFKNIINFL